MLFEDRNDAGSRLCQKLADFKENVDVIVLGLPRGGVIVAKKVAEFLNAPLDIVVPRKIGAPGNEEFAIGAIIEDGEGIFDHATIKAYGISQDYIDDQVIKEKEEAMRRVKTYRSGRSALALKDKIVILVDDGVATGATMRAAIASVKKKNPSKIVVAAPVIAADTLALIEEEADQVVYLDAPECFGAVGAFYKNFLQTTDEEVIQIMRKN